MDSEKKQSDRKKLGRVQTPWTYSQIQLVPPGDGRRIADAVRGDLVADVRYYGTVTPATVQREDLPGLEDKKWMWASTSSFYCYEVGNAYVEGAPGRGMDLVVLHSETWGYGKCVHTTPPLVRAKDAPCSLDYKYIAFPGNDTGTHFFLWLIAWPSDLLLEVNPLGPVRTTAFILNSLAHLQPRDPEDYIKNIIINLSSGRPLRSSELQNTKVQFPFMPQQPNSHDCGLYPGYFLSVFLTDPDKYLAYCMGNLATQESPAVLWKQDGILSARKRLKSLIESSAELRQATFDFSSDLLGPL